MVILILSILIEAFEFHGSDSFAQFPIGGLQMNTCRYGIQHPTIFTLTFFKINRRPSQNPLNPSRDLLLQNRILLNKLVTTDVQTKMS